MPVVDCQGRPVGAVDDLDAGRIRLADGAAGGVRFIPLADISTIDDDRATYQLTLEEIEAGARDGGPRAGTEG